MPGPAPSSSPDRQQRPGRDLPWTDIPAGPREGRAPAAPKWAAFGPAAKQWWAWAWKLTVAKAWGEEEHATAARRAELEDKWKAGDTKVLAEMRHCETALGMTPKARKELRWRIVDGDTVVEQNGEPKVADELAARRSKATKAS